MKNLIKKEWLYGVRNHKLLIIAITYLFFAFSVPLMVKVLLPALLQSQFPGMSEADIALMIDISQMGSMTNYLSNVFEVGLIVMGFTLAGLMASEIKENTLVLPVCSGKSYESILFSKMLVFSTFIVSISMLSMLITYAYSGIIFGFDIPLLAVIKSALLDGLYMTLLITLLLTFGTFVKRTVATGLLSIGTLYVLSLLGNLMNIQKYLPSGLVSEASLFRATVNQHTFLPVGFTVIIIGALLFVTLQKLKNTELNQR